MRQICASDRGTDGKVAELLLQGERMLGGVFPEAAYTLHAQKMAGGKMEEDHLDELRN
jgi:hypothetical protein